MKTENVLGQIVKSARIKKGFTQLEVANKLGYDSMQFVSLFERGLSKIPMGTLGKLFVILNFPFRERRLIIKGLVMKYETDITDEIVQGEKAILK